MIDWYFMLRVSVCLCLFVFLTWCRINRRALTHHNYKWQGTESEMLIRRVNDNLPHVVARLVDMVINQFYS